RIEVGDEHIADAQQGEVLQNLVTQGPGADHQHARRRELFLVPPFDLPEAIETLRRGRVEVRRGRHVRRAPRSFRDTGAERRSPGLPRPAATGNRAAGPPSRDETCTPAAGRRGGGPAVSFFP